MQRQKSTSQPATWPQSAVPQSPSSPAAPWPSAACPCPTEKLKTHTCSEGELTLFLLLINRGKTKQCWRRSSAWPDPARPPPPADSRAGRKVRAWGGGKHKTQLAQPQAERERIPGKKCSTALPFISWGGKKRALSTSGFGEEPSVSWCGCCARGSPPGSTGW